MIKNNLALIIMILALIVSIVAIFLAEADKTMNIAVSATITAAIAGQVVSKSKKKED